MRLGGFLGVASRTEELEALKEATLDLASQALEARDPVIAKHSARVAELAARLAQQLDLDKRSVRLIHTAGRLHDLGMIGIRDSLLNKPGPLREDEWEVMRRHPDIAADMIAWHRALAEVTPMVRHHHERWDRTGYPAGLGGEVIPIGSRIVAVAEAFDTITTKRIYRPTALSSEDAVRDISERSETWYDPTVVEALRGFRTFPP